MADVSRDKCSAIARSGSRCRSSVLPGRPFCFLHDPAAAAARIEGARKGGRNRSNKQRARKVIAEPMTPAEIQSLLGLALRGVLAGKVEPGVANAAAKLGRALVAVREATELEERLTTLEAAAGIGKGQAA